MKTFKTKLCSALIIVSMLFANPSQAQFGKELKERLKENLKEKTLQKSDEAVEVGIDEGTNLLIKSIFKKKDKKNPPQKARNPEEDIDGGEYMETAEDTPMSNEELQQQIMGMLGGKAGNAETEEIYTFSKRIVYSMSSSVNDKPTNMDYTVWLNPETDYMATQMGKITQNGKSQSMAMGMTNIMDYQHHVMIMIMEKQKIAQIMPMDKITGDLTDEDGESKKTATLTKTGRTKTILDYECEEYQISSEDMNGLMWIAPDIEGYNQSLMKSLGSSSFDSNPELANLKGIMMEMDATIYSVEDDKETQMLMKIMSIDEQQRVFTLSDYRSFTSNFGSMEE